MSDQIPDGYQQTTWKVEGLGDIRGWIDPDGSTQFFGVPYADLSARFRHSTLKTSWEGGKCDCTSMRGYSPQPERKVYPFLIPDRPNAGKMYIDEFDSFNLQITIPAGAKPTDRLPVLVYVHGGAFIFGTGNYSLLDGKALAKESVELGIPTIIITFNYRCGFFGFLCSSDIAEDNEQFGGGNGNFGLMDQKNALLWINQYISSFGGDPSRLTVAGQSAGAASMDVHLRSPHNNLFSSVILLSGTAPICGVYTPEEYEVLYYKLLTEVGIPHNLPPAERLTKLRQTPHEVVAHASHAVFQGLEQTQFGIGSDVSIFGKDFQLTQPSDYPGKKLDYPGRIMIGDCLHEGIIYVASYGVLNGEQAISVIRKHVPEDFLAKYLDHYGIKPSMSAQEVSPCLQLVLTDCMFTAPPYYIEQANPEKTYSYHFNQASELDNPWRGLAHHSLDYMYVFGNIRFRLNEASRKLTKVMASDFLTFANGKAPYPAVGDKMTSRTYGPNGAYDVTEGPSAIMRPVEWFEEIKPYMNELFKLAGDLNVYQSELLSYDYGPGSKGEHGTARLVPRG
ncbi:Alpha/Beta hydrolase protein [Naematelia encephala]|uniref:Carboxylic ester hydrolase n=1 Tax=Naematelia encephala TaxID=71784 RepID=A0A1Y2AK11_9TREE|nr:Alpha/Beta hydrolase protein [Naematelia encephala]